MTAHIIQVAAATTGAASAAGAQVTFPSPVTAGSTIVAFVLLSSGNTITLVSDNLNGGYGAGLNLKTDTVDNYSFGSLAFQNSLGGTMTVTAVFNGATTQRGIIAVEVGGVAVASVDGHIGAFQATPGVADDGITTGSGVASTNANQPAIIVAAAFLAQSSVLTQGTGFDDWGTFPGSTATGGVYRVESQYLTTSGIAQLATFTAGNDKGALSLMVILDELNQTTVLLGQACL